MSLPKFGIDLSSDPVLLESRLPGVRRFASGKVRDVYDLGETLLEVGLVICSITLLTKRHAYWVAGIVFGVAGIVLTIMGGLIH